MKNNEPKDLSDEELFQKQKTLKKRAIGNSLLIGILLGIAIFSGVKNGIGFATFFPLVLLYFLIKK